MVLQGMDASGKDGTIRGVFSAISPLGVHTRSWRAPSEEERSHDYLWRIHQAVPGTGEITIFNRSHYEDVLVPLVNGALDRADAARALRPHQRLRTACWRDTGTLILKFMLHISKKEQAGRLQARLDDPTKAWKFSLHDLEVRKQWQAYRKAYELILSHTSTPHAAWTIVPADSKTHRNLMIATVVRDALKALKLRYPPPDPALKSQGGVTPGRLTFT